MDHSEIEKFRDPIWRISNLYSIRERGGKVIPFRPRPQQAQVLDMIFRRGLKRIVILKARQLGFSTLLGVICADQLCWNTGRQISLIDKTQLDAQQKLKNIISLAYDSLSEKLKERFVVSRANAGEFGVRFFEYEAAQTSTMFAGTHARGGSNFFVWISEWGVIQAEDLKRSEEILTGAIPSAKDGLAVVETTWRGGRGGHLWDIVKKALETPEEQKHADDWRVVFFPWQDDPAYCDAEPQILKEETVRYFANKPGFSDGQKSWYQKAQDQFGLFMLREFPTVLEECFQTPIEGAIYADLIDRLRTQGAIRPAAIDASGLVHTAWDLGSPINTVVWYFSIVNAEIRVIDCDSDLDLSPVQRVARMLAKGYLYGSHFLPHDAQATQKRGKTFLTELNEIGLRNCKAVPQTHDVWIGLNRLRQLLPRFSFRIPACERGLEALSNYHTARTTSTGLAVDAPVHDWSSHWADGLRTLAEAEMAGMLHSAGSSANGRRMRHVTVLTGFRGDTRESPPNFLDQFFSGSKPKPRVRVS
jgi:nucleoid-associated protein YgaU